MTFEGAPPTLEIGAGETVTISEAVELSITPYPTLATAAGDTVTLSEAPALKILTTLTVSVGDSIIVGDFPGLIVGIGYDAFSAATPGTGNLSWTHTPVNTPRGALVFIIQNASTADRVSGVTYGGVAMTA